MNDELLMLGARLLLDLVCVGLLVRVVYMRGRPGRDLSFPLVMLNLVTFALTVLLSSARFELGLGLGLFAIFGILRYRTRTIRIEDLTYLFVSIGLAVIQGVAPDLVQAVVMDSVLILVPAAMEFASKPTRRINLIHDRAELAAISRRDELMADLNERLGLDIVSVDVIEVDLLRDTARLDIRVRD